MANFNVSTSAGLQTALARATGGDRIILAPGNYGQVYINGRNFSSAVTIQSAGRPGSAHFDGLDLRYSNNITFQSIDLGRALTPGQTIYTNLSQVRNSNNIRLLGVKMHGSEDGNHGNDGQGLIVSDSNNFRMENSDISNLTRGVYVERSNNVTFNKNNFHDVRMDGLAVASTHALYVTDNVFQNFRPQAGDHGDAIQLWNTNQTKGSSNILIQDNVIWMPQEQPDGTAGIQGIWISDPGRYGYQNVWIRNNLVYSNDIWNGISVIGGRNVDVSNNTLLSRPDDDERLWIRLEDGVQNNVSNNVMEDFIVKATSPTTRNNWDLRQTPGSRRFFKDLFTPDSLTDLITPGVGFQMKTLGHKSIFGPNMLDGINDIFESETDTIDLSGLVEALPAEIAVDDIVSADVSVVTAPDVFEAVAEIAAPVAVAAPAGSFHFATDWYVAMA